MPTQECTTKRCTKCGEEFPATNEYFYRNGKDKLDPRCKSCKLKSDCEIRRRQGAKPPHRVEIIDGKKQCSHCKEWKTATTDFFVADLKSKNGLRSWCNDCMRIYAEQSRRAKGINSTKKIVIDGKQQCSKCEDWKVLEDFSPSKIMSTGRASVCRSCSSADLRNRYLNDPTYRERKYEWRIKNIDKARTTQKITHAKRKAQKKLTTINDFSDHDWQRAIDYFGRCCAACGCAPDFWHKLVPDHWKALARGGDNSRFNVVPLCHSMKGGVDGCNTTKHAKDAFEWLKDRFGKRKSKQILKRINTYFEWLKSQE